MAAVGLMERDALSALINCWNFTAASR